MVDVLRSLDTKWGLAPADSYLRKTGECPEELVELLARSGKGLHGKDHAVQTALLANPLAENGGESVARGQMLELGYQEPQLQVPFANPVDPGHPYRVDFCWGLPDGRSIIGELDGMGKYRACRTTSGADGRDMGPDADPDMVRVFSDERVRESRLTLCGAPVVRFRFDEVLNTPFFSCLLDAAGVPKADGR